ncbi:MAG: histidine phosphatase family protein [Candidatus Saccharicenans sp.]|nr:histidine phosphatase family protein [Candidatus Saccharicenans sp.]MDI6848791.1 histidine phosphatase family protein [Candidatus Saccharicenans sp.]
MTRLLLVRHGQTEWNRVERFRGSADIPLNENGLCQAELLARRIVASWKPTAVYSSPLSRSVRTGEAIASLFNLEVRVHPGLSDINYGQWQGLTPEEVKERWPELYQRWRTVPADLHFPGGESMAERQRIGVSAVREIAEAHPGETVVAVGHTVINRLIIMGLLGLDWSYFWRLRQDNSALNVFEYLNRQFIAVTINETGHLLKY